MSDLITKSELNNLKTVFDNNLRGEYGIDSKRFIFKLDHFRYEEVKLTKRKGIFNSKQVETGEIAYKILGVYFYASNISKGMIGSWNHFYIYTSPMQFFDSLMNQVKNFKSFTEDLKIIDLELTVKS
jgi:hypothetical protein